METKESLRCRGMRDLMPTDMVHFRRIEDTFRRVCAAWGYQEARTPTIEYLHLFTRAGTLSPQMLERVYSFLDWDSWSGERVVLRPDATIPTVRLFVENLRGQGIAKLCYVQNVFRFADGDQQREDWQCGVELIGEPSLNGDIELILVALDTLAALGLPDVKVRLSHAGLLRTVLARTGQEPAQQLNLYDRILEGDAAVLREVERDLPDLRLPLRLLFGLENGGREYLTNLQAALVPVLPEVADPLADLKVMMETLTPLGCTCEVAPALVRNFEYYTGPIFHLEVAGVKVGGGGRYDDLVSLVGGEAVPASGFALDIPTLVGIVPPPKEQAWPRGVLVHPGTSISGLVAALAAARYLHGLGHMAEIVSEPRVATRPRWDLIIDVVDTTIFYKLVDRLDGSSQRLERLEEIARALGVVSQ